MKNPLVTSVLLAAAMMAEAQVYEFDISPGGVSAANGLSPLNELHAVIDSTGSGGETMSGIRVDAENMILHLCFGYGSIAGFTDITGPATALHIHGPAPASGTADVLIDLAPLHVPAPNPEEGGVVLGDVILDQATMDNILAGFTYINIHTELNPMGELRGQLVIDLNPAPIISPLEPLTLQSTSPDGAEGTLSVEVSDADDDPLTIVWTVNGQDVQTNIVEAGQSAAGATVSFTAVFPLGTNNVTATVTDDEPESDSTMTTVTVSDVVPPEILSITATPRILWPPNHRMRPVRIRVRATDECSSLTTRVISVTSNEPVDGLGDGSTVPDYRIVRPRPQRPRIQRNDGEREWCLSAPLTVLLRAERSGGGDGRTYYIEVEVEDALGNVTSETLEVHVPHSRGRGHAYGHDKRHGPPTHSKANMGKKTQRKKRR